MGRHVYLIACLLLGWGMVVHRADPEGFRVPPGAPLGVPLVVLGRGLILLVIAAMSLLVSQRVGRRATSPGGLPSSATPPRLPRLVLALIAVLLGSLLGAWPALAAVGLVLSAALLRHGDQEAESSGDLGGALCHGLAATGALSLGVTSVMAWSAGTAPVIGLLRVLEPAPELVAADAPRLAWMLAPAPLAALLAGGLDDDRANRRRWWSVTALALLLIAATALLVHDRPWRARWGQQVDWAQQVAAAVVAVGLVRLLVVAAALPAAAARSAVWACAALLPAVLLFEGTDSVALQLPLVVAALVVGGSSTPRRARRSLRPGARAPVRDRS